jgi:hypothetical protein
MVQPVEQEYVFIILIIKDDDNTNPLHHRYHQHQVTLFTIQMQRWIWRISWWWKPFDCRWRMEAINCCKKKNTSVVNIKRERERGRILVIKSCMVSQPVGCRMSDANPPPLSVLFTFFLYHICIFFFIIINIIIIKSNQHHCCCLICVYIII